LKNEANSEHFEIDASVVFQLGESLITDAVSALMELVKNSYDADATFCKLAVSTTAIEDPESPFKGALGSIRIEDDGSGMSLETIRSGWLTISNSGKRILKRQSGTTAKGRTPLGDKGLGRLGTQRLGSNLEMITLPSGSSVQQHVWFSWKDFAMQRVLSEVMVHREQEKPSRGRGTTLIISGLRDLETWRTSGKSDLETQLSQMISPYRAVRDFVVRAEVDGTTLNLVEITERLRDLAQLRYRLEFNDGSLNVFGRARLTYLRPEATDPGEKAKFRELVELDEGKALFQYLNSKKRAPDFRLELNHDGGWFVSFGKTIVLEELNTIARINGKAADPGPFAGEVDFFSLSTEASAEQDIYTVGDYRRTVEKHSGIKVYRDGFGIRVSNDWLNLGRQWTKARSYYTLKPQNTLGYIAISAKENAQLQEKTDREGFTDNAYYQNFLTLLTQFVDFSADAQEFLRRGYNDFRKAHEKKEANVPEEITPEALSLRLGATLGRAGQYRYKVQEAGRKLKETITEADELLTNLGTGEGGIPSPERVAALVRKLRDEASGAAKEVLDAQKYLEEASSMSNAGKVLAAEITELRDQIRQVYEVISLGLTAEALSHEINNVISQLGERTTKLSRSLRSSASKDLKLFTYLEYVESAVAALRRQMAFMEPSLRYAREKRERIDLAEYSQELLQHYTLHFIGAAIRIEITAQPRKGTFVINMNRGKLIQIIDNLVLNSEYWLKDSFRTGAARGSVAIELKRPYIYVSDSGPGIDPTVENSLFEPFVSTKGKGRGRGLGLYVVQQLLRSDGCDIQLMPDRNARGRLYKFQIDLAGALIQ
jgi:signal transduction histidine kinase